MSAPQASIGRPAQRIAALPPYLFAEADRQIKAKRAAGHDVISLGVGDPDLPTPPSIVDALAGAARDPKTHRYPEYYGLSELRQAIAVWYGRRFGVELKPDGEVLPLVGSKEGVFHLPLAFVDPGDVVLVPDPGYPVYSAGTIMAGGVPYLLPLRDERGFLPDLESIPSEVARRARVLWINYPNNPTGATADLDFFERVVAFARRHEVLVCHDNAYSDVSFDGYRPPSFLEVPGAMDVGIEFHSLSKTYNMTGWRIGMVVGNARALDTFGKVKTNVDSGVFEAVQRAAISALSGDQSWLEGRNRVYQARRDRTIAALRQIGVEVTPPRASLYVWARVPGGGSSLQYSLDTLEHALVWVTPGVGFGDAGEGYFRISLTTPDDRLDEALRRLTAAGRARPSA
jgi:LL-diaminopimelate aminotransferase